MLAIVLAATASLPPNALVPVTTQCPALHAMWDPLQTLAGQVIFSSSNVDAEQAAGKALHACGARVRDDEHALALMLIDDLDASFSEQTAMHGVVDPAQIHRQYWGLYDQVFDDAQHWSAFLHFPRSQQCGKLFVQWIQRERDDMSNRGIDPTHPLLALSSSMDATTRSCVIDVTGWQTPSQRKA
jgi:hypothetical protein